MTFLPTNGTRGPAQGREWQLSRPIEEGAVPRAFPRAAGRRRQQQQQQDGGGGQGSGVGRREADLQPGPGRGEAARPGALPGLVPRGAQHGWVSDARLPLGLKVGTALMTLVKPAGMARTSDSVASVGLG